MELVAPPGPASPRSSRGHDRLRPAPGLLVASVVLDEALELASDEPAHGRAALRCDHPGLPDHVLVELDGEVSPAHDLTPLSTRVAVLHSLARGFRGEEM